MGASPSADIRWIVPLSIPAVSNRILSSLDWSSLANMERACSLTKMSITNYFKGVSELSIALSLADYDAVVIKLQSKTVEPESIAQLVKWLGRRASWIDSLKLFYFVDCPSWKVEWMVDEGQELLRDVLLVVKDAFRDLRTFTVDACTFAPLVGINLWMAMPNLENVELGVMPAAGAHIADQLDDGASDVAVAKLIEELVGLRHMLRSIKVFRFVSLLSTLGDALDCAAKLHSLGLCRALCPRPSIALPSFNGITHLQLYSARLAYSDDDVRLLSGLSTLFPRLVHCELIEPWMGLVPLAVRSFLLYKHAMAKRDRPADLVLALTKADLGRWNAQLMPALKVLFNRRHRSYALSQAGDYRVVAKLRNASVAVYANI
uniref:F-box domain-containing protein n=1 Tax=Plectus sambesii TaxID=2011161 RepID=A0A914XI02_9BILA